MNADFKELADQIEAAGLGPATVDVICVGDRDVVTVELDSASRRKARTLLRWLSLIAVRDMTCGKFRATDRRLRLHLRGLFPSGTPVIVSAGFDLQAEAEQVELIEGGIETWWPADLVRRLARLEVRSTSSARTTRPGEAGGRA